MAIRVRTLGQPGLPDDDSPSNFCSSLRVSPPLTGRGGGINDKYRNNRTSRIPHPPVRWMSRQKAPDVVPSLTARGQLGVRLDGGKLISLTSIPTPFHTPEIGGGKLRKRNLLFPR